MSYVRSESTGRHCEDDEIACECSIEIESGSKTSLVGNNVVSFIIVNGIGYRRTVDLQGPCWRRCRDGSEG